MLRFALQFKGAEVLECADVDETLALLEARQLELMLVSFYPREQEGYVLLEKMRERVVTAVPPLILVGDAVLRAECRAQLCHGIAWLDRPFRVSDLLSLVDGIFSRQPVERTTRTA